MGPYPVAQLDNSKGLLFATFDPEAALDNVPTALLRIRPLAAGADRVTATPKESCMATGFGRLVDAENGLISRRILIEPEIYPQELGWIFARCLIVSVPRKPDAAAR